MYLAATAEKEKGMCFLTINCLFHLTSGFPNFSPHRTFCFSLFVHYFHLMLCGIDYVDSSPAFNRTLNTRTSYRTCIVSCVLVDTHRLVIRRCIVALAFWSRVIAVGKQELKLAHHFDRCLFHGKRHNV